MIFWQHILDRIRDDQAVYILTVIENSGSSPGRKGFKMMVAEDGFIFGSVGGGVMESSLVEEAKHLLSEGKSATFIKRQIHRGAIEHGSGMICSGEQTVAFHRLDHNHVSVIKNVIDCLQSGGNGSLSLTQNSYSFSKQEVESQFMSHIDSKEDWSFDEHVGFREMLYIVGGGHVGVAVSQLFISLGFHVVVFDNRDGLNTLESNNFAHQKIVVDYNGIQDHVHPSDHSYVAIMTNKYTDDKLVLSKLLRNNHKFIGVLGSKAKLKTMWKDLLKEGFTKEELLTVYAPIGMSIKSETPMEIAVSVAAQIIQIKNKPKDPNGVRLL